MAKDDTISKFMKIKDEIVTNLEALKNRVNDCVGLDMLDIESQAYNMIYALIDDALGIHNYPELAEIVERGKEVEHNIDAWMSSKGFTTLSLDWPEIPEGE